MFARVLDAARENWGKQFLLGRKDFLEKRVVLLESAIRKHRDQEDDDRCWMDDQELYESLGEPREPREFSTVLPPKCEFLESCSRFWEKRQHPIDVADDQCAESRFMTIRELTDRIAELEAELKRIHDHPEDWCG